MYYFPLQRKSKLSFVLQLTIRRATKCVLGQLSFFFPAFNYSPDNHSVSTNKGFTELMLSDDRNARILRLKHSLRERISPTLFNSEIGNPQKTECTRRGVEHEPTSSSDALPQALMYGIQIVLLANKNKIGNKNFSTVFIVEGFAQYERQHFKMHSKMKFISMIKHILSEWSS